jgi:hypothetical protein
MYLHISKVCPTTVADIDSKFVMFPNLPVSFNCLELVIIKVFAGKGKFINISFNITILSEETVH